MGAQHTPGPWSATAPDGSYHDVIRIFCDADREEVLPVAICPQRQSAIMSVLSGQTDTTTEAACNARLIAAAPDMLAAIERFMPKGIAIGNGNVPDDLCVPMDVTMGELRAFEAAIAKARGAA